MSSAYTQMLINLSLVLGLIGILFFLTKKIKQKKYQDQPIMQIMNTLSIGAKEKILLIEVNKKIILLGATPNQISTLHVFDRPMASEEEEMSASLSNFSELMKLKGNSTHNGQPQF